MNLLDGLHKKLDGYFHKTNGVNYVKIFDTPKIWGFLLERR